MSEILSVASSFVSRIFHQGIEVDYASSEDADDGNIFPIQINTKPVTITGRGYINVHLLRKILGYPPKFRYKNVRKAYRMLRRSARKEV